MLRCCSPDGAGVHSSYQLTGFMLFGVLSLNLVIVDPFVLTRISAFVNNNLKSLKGINKKEKVRPGFGWREKPGNVIQI